MPIACFQLPMSLNYDFTKTKDCLRTDVVGCLTPSPYVTGLPNQGSKPIPSHNFKHDMKVPVTCQV